MKKINIRESLLNMDRETDCKYDLTSLYESCKLDDEKKKELCQYIDKVDIEATNRFLSNEAASQGLMENASDDIADEELNEWFDDDWHGDDESTYEYIASKSVPDSDGFYTDYTWYRNVDTDQHVFVFGDNDIYKPEHGDSDHECDSYEEAQEWFDSYNGFDEVDESLNESPDLIPIEVIPDNRKWQYSIGGKDVPYTEYDEAKAHFKDEFDITDYRDELNQFIKSHKGYEYRFDVDVVRDHGEDKLYIDIPWGDWKHEHWAADHLVQKFFMDKGLSVKCDTRTYEEDGSDTYSAEHFYSLDDFVLSGRPIKESLEEDFKPGDQVFCKANKKVGTVKSVKGDNVEVEFTGGEDPDRIDTYYKQDLQLNEDVANFDEIQQQAMEDDADQEEMRDYIENVYIDVLDELEEEYPGLFLQSNVQGDRGSIEVWFTENDVEYYATWDYTDELIDLSEMFFDATSAEDFKASLRNFLESKLSTAEPIDDDIDESVEQPTKEEVVESLTPAKRTLDEGWFSDDDFEDDMMHTDMYGGDPMYCRTCGSKLDYSDGYGFCPQCNPQDDELEYVGEESIVEGVETFWQDIGGGFGETNEVYGFTEIKDYWKNNYDSDPSLMAYDSFNAWWNDTKKFMKQVSEPGALEEDKVNKFVLMGVKEDNSKHYYNKESNKWVAKSSDATLFDDRNSATELWSDIDKKDFDKVTIMIKPEELDEDLEGDLDKRYRPSSTNASIERNLEKLLSSDSVKNLELVTMYDNEVTKLTSSDGRIFYLVPSTLSQFDVYDEQENLIATNLFTLEIPNELLETGEPNYTYQVVGGDYAGNYSREEIEALPCFSGKYTREDRYSKPELVNQPILDGYLSPMFNGWRENHTACIRYETQEVYDMMSEATDLSSKKGTLGNLISSNNDLIKTFTTKEEIINFLIDVEPQCTNKKYLNKVKMDIIHSKNFTRALQYLYDAMLKGDGFGSIEKEIRGNKYRYAYESLDTNAKDVYTMFHYIPGSLESGINGDSFDPVCSFFANSLEDAKKQVQKFDDLYNIGIDSYYVQQGYWDNDEEVYSSLEAYYQDIDPNEEWPEIPFTESLQESAKALTYKELIDLALEHYNEGGDGVYECWDERVFNDYVKSFGPITKSKALNMFKLNYDIDNEERAAARYFSGELEEASEINTEVETSEEDDIKELEQEFSSKDTSINSSKLPAVFKLVHFNPGTVNLDYGGGKFDNVAEYLAQDDVTNLVYDPYNRSQEHNKEVIATIRKNGGADTVTCSNVLNVIKEEEVRLNVLNNIKKLVKPNGTVYITVYEGSGANQGAATKAGYQLNRKTADYLEEIQQVFPDATRRGKLIIAHPNGSVQEAIDPYKNKEQRGTELGKLIVGDKFTKDGFEYEVATKNDDFSDIEVKPIGKRNPKDDINSGGLILMRGSDIVQDKSDYLNESSDEENWAVFATDESTGQEYCAGVYEDRHYANYWAAMDRSADVEYDYGTFKYRVEQVPEYTQEMVNSQRELNALKIANREAAEEELRSVFEEHLTEAKTGIPYKGFTICYGCHGTDRWYIKDSYGTFLGTKSGYSTEEEATEYIDDELTNE